MIHFLEYFWKIVAEILGDADSTTGQVQNQDSVGNGRRGCWDTKELEGLQWNSYLWLPHAVGFSSALAALHAVVFRSQSLLQGWLWQACRKLPGHPSLQARPSHLWTTGSTEDALLHCGIPRRGHLLKMGFHFIELFAIFAWGQSRKDTVSPRVPYWRTGTCALLSGSVR